MQIQLGSDPLVRLEGGLILQVDPMDRGTGHDRQLADALRQLVRAAEYVEQAGHRRRRLPSVRVVILCGPTTACSTSNSGQLGMQGGSSKLAFIEELHDHEQGAT